MKLHVTINGGTLAGRIFDLESGFLTIGRGDNCSIRFDPVSERIASKQHAFIEAKADGYYLTDNKSTNGTILNGAPVTSAKLSSGDQIQFGRNGVMATVRIEDQPVPASTAPAIAQQQSFRDLQVAQFNQIARQEPVSLQNSFASFGLGSIAAATEPETDKTKKYIGAVIGILVVVFLIVVAGLLITWTLSTKQGELTITLDGILFAAAASFVAFIPAIIYVVPLIWLDRYDPEPPWLLAMAFAWGALVAVIFSFIVNTGVGRFAFLITGSPGCANFISAVISAPIFEEMSKGTGVLVLLIFFRRYFDDILDGIVFAGVIALGFATVENVLYYGGTMAHAAEGEVGQSLAIIFVLRGILSPFAHVTFTSMTGIGCGISRESHNAFVRFAMPVVGYICAVTLHAIWNGMSIVAMIVLKGFEMEGVCDQVGLGGDNIGLCAFGSSYVVLEIPLFLVFVAFAFYVMRRQGRILREMLAIDIARGLISPELGTTVTSAFKSSLWLINGLFAGKYKARSHYLRAAGKLGLSYWHIQRATAAHGQTGSFQQNPILRDEVLKWRDQV